jgi:hypothetical protein
MKTLILLGPYRNLTTLTTALLSLHPNIIAYNHGLVRMPKNVLFYEDPTNKQKYQNFIDYILANYQSGHRGTKGGDIRKCHAFDPNKHETMYQMMESTEFEKQDPKVIVWKESGRLIKYFRHNGKFNSFDRIERLLKSNPDVYFIRPVRNPIDCVQSNMDTNHARFTDFNPHDYPKACNQRNAFLRWYINDLIWFLKLEYCFPGRFLHYNESEFPIQKLFQMVFPKLNPELPIGDELPITSDYIEKVTQGYRITPKPIKHKLYREFINYYQKRMNNNKIPNEIKSKLTETLQIYLNPNQSSMKSPPSLEIDQS